MKYEGPLPDEALPVGEEPLSPEELGRVASTMFEMREIPGIITEEDVSPERWAAIQALKTRLQGSHRMFEILKEAVIEQRE